MVDLHTHILPGIDDGSKSPEMSLQMLRLLAQQGVTTVAATPHFSALKESPEEFLVRRNQAVAQLPVEEGLPRVLPGAEVAYFAGMSRCEALPLLRIGDSDLILIEMPFNAWTDRMMEEICTLSHHMGLMPVLAHVDRYDRKDQFARYESELAGQVFFQYNADAFLKTFGNRAMSSLRHGGVHFLGTDCHNMERRAPNMGEALAKIRKRLGNEVLEELTTLAESWLFPEA